MFFFLVCADGLHTVGFLLFVVYYLQWLLKLHMQCTHTRATRSARGHQQYDNCRNTTLSSTLSFETRCALH